MTGESRYTTQLQAGLGVEETLVLFDLWEPGMDSRCLFQITLDSGIFPSMSARRLRNMIAEGFAPRYLVCRNEPAQWLKKMKSALSSSAFAQLLFLYTSRANLILADFVRQIYWNRYGSGHDAIANEDAVDFIFQAGQEGLLSKPWSEGTVARVACCLTAHCADFGLLEKGTRSTRKIRAYRIEPSAAAILAYDLHFSGMGDNALIAHPDWALFGLVRDDVRDELKRLSLRGFFIYQTAGDITRIGWTFKTWEDMIDVISQR